MIFLYYCKSQILAHLANKFEYLPLISENLSFVQHCQGNQLQNLLAEFGFFTHRLQLEMMNPFDV